MSLYKAWDIKRQKRKVVVTSEYGEFAEAGKFSWFSISDFLRKEGMTTSDLYEVNKKFSTDMIMSMIFSHST